MVYLAFNYSALLFFAVQAVVLVPFYLRHLNPRLYGAWLATGNIAAYLGVLDFGITTVLVQRTAALAGAGDDTGLLRVMGTGVATLCLLATLPLGLGLAVSPYVAGFVEISGVDSVELTRAFRWACVGSSLMMLSLAIHAVLLGLQRQFVPGIVGLSANVCGIATTVLAFKGGLGLSSIPLGVVSRGLLTSSAFGLYLAALVTREFRARPKWDLGEFRHLWRQSLWAFSANVASSQCDNLVVGVVNDPTQVTTLNMTRKMGELVGMIAKQMPSALMPGLSHLSGSGDSKRVREVSMSLLHAALFVGVVGLGTMFLLNETFVQLWVGAEVFGGVGVTGLVAVATMLSIMTATSGSILYALGAIGYASRVTMVEGVCRAGLTIVLCKWLGYRGVLIAAIVTAASVSLPIQFWRYARVVKARPGWMLRQLGSSAVKGVAIVVALRLVSKYSPVATGYGMLALQGVLFASSIAAMLLLVDRSARYFIKEIWALRRARRAAGVD